MIPSHNVSEKQRKRCEQIDEISRLLMDFSWMLHNRNLQLDQLIRSNTLFCMVPKKDHANTIERRQRDRLTPDVNH